MNGTRTVVAFNNNNEKKNKQVFRLGKTAESNSERVKWSKFALVVVVVVVGMHIKCERAWAQLRNALHSHANTHFLIAYCVQYA